MTQHEWTWVAVIISTVTRNISYFFKLTVGTSLGGAPFSKCCTWNSFQCNFKEFCFSFYLWNWKITSPWRVSMQLQSDFVFIGWSVWITFVSSKINLLKVPCVSVPILFFNCCEQLIYFIFVIRWTMNDKSWPAISNIQNKLSGEFGFYLRSKKIICLNLCVLAKDIFSRAKGQYSINTQYFQSMVKLEIACFENYVQVKTKF